MSSVNPGAESGSANHPSSAQTAWQTLIADATIDAADAEELLNPLTYAGIVTVKLGSRSTRLFVRGCLNTEVTGVTTSPTVRLYAFSGDPEIPASIKPIGRIDAATWGAAGIALTANASPSATTMITTGDFRYTEILPATSDKVGYDALGASFVVGLVQIPAVIAGSGGVFSVEIGVLN